MVDIIQIGNVMPTKTRDNPNQGRVYSRNGLAPSITNVSGGGGRQPMIISIVSTKGDSWIKQLSNCLPE